MTLELLRNRWTYPFLVALLDAPLRPAQLLEAITEGIERNVDLVGPRVLHERSLFTTLQRMEAEGLIVRRTDLCSPNGVAPRDLTAMSRGLLAALDRIAAWASVHREELATALRKRRGLPQPGAGSGESVSAGTSTLRPDREHWRGVGMALVTLRLRWSFSVLCQLSHGPQHPTGITAAINAGIARNRDIAGRRSLSEKVLWDTLHRLIEVGLINHQPRVGQFASTAQCTLTPSGYALLAALAPIGNWAVEHETHLTAVVRRRRGLT
ncbi:hypothetical protein OHT76_05575 [Streptomyces sp. NBC_00287]|uniref:winged helix-turn-helix transcriptional regulator n=1 Tax=Streptomyces sp. NBC_00287 TaxID=2975702 RepID=UPI002E2882F3|nr:hypothetical protein [Streptomyces sp. NBC_00287]